VEAVKMHSKSNGDPMIEVAKSKNIEAVQLAKRPRLGQLGRALYKYRWLYLMILPGFIYFVLFRYLPLWNAQIAFKQFKPLLGVWGSPFVGFKNFITFFHSFYFTELLANTVIISLLKLVLGMPMAIVLALCIYETAFKRLARFVQTISYLPHFLSWVIMYGILLVMLSPDNGLVNEAIKAAGGDPIAFLYSPQWFRTVVVGSDIWKDTGWGTILYLAALMSIDPTLFEAAAVDGASRLQRIWHISLPGILSTIVVVTLLRLGNILDAGFQQIFMLYSLPVYSVGDIIDTWVYRQGILEFQFSLATAVGLFKGVIGLVLVLIANRLTKRFSGSGIYS
jgi:putative aldouronate transport system permease protein